MIFMIILTVAIIALAVFFFKVGEEDASTNLSGIAFIMMLLTVIFKVDAKKDVALMRCRLENPTAYTYSQLAEQNEHVAEIKYWQGTPFSFYNGVDLQLIDIDSVSQKVIIK